MRLRALLLVVPLAALLVACGGNDTPPESDASSTPVPTATPYDVTPTPIIVSGISATGGGASGQEITYTVESGDTLLVLAARYDTTVEAIMRRNNLASAADLQVGQQLIIPRGTSSVATPAATARPASPGATAAPGGGRTYEVKSGDLAGSIAAQFGVSLDQLAAANHRSVESLDQLQVGETLVIP
jgi:LysM repeat protein